MKRALIVLLVLAGCASPDEVEAEQKDRDEKIAEDVELQACEIDAGGYMTATVKITNHSSDPSTYSVEVAFESKDKATQYGTGSAFVNELMNGQSTTAEANSLTEAVAGFTCRVADVTRFAS
jgi:hypothetical protein